MINFSSLPASIATNESVRVPAVIKGFTSIEVQDENQIYTDLSRRLIDIEKQTDIERELVSTIESEARHMILLVDEKKELLMRCDWLKRLYNVKEQLMIINAVEEATRLKLTIKTVQTCPLKNELIKALNNLEQTLEGVPVQPSNKEALNEAIFNTGNQTFINLGIVGRNAVLEDVVNTDGQVQTAISKAEELEARVQTVKQHDTVEAFQEALQSLPLGNLADVPKEHEQAILQKVLDNRKWQGLFHLDRLIRQYTLQVEKQHEPEQEGIHDTVVVNPSLMKKMGVQQIKE